MGQKKAIDSLMGEGRKFPPPEQIKANAYVNSMEQFQQMWERSIDDSDNFWLEQAKSLHWDKEPTKAGTRNRQRPWNTRGIPRVAKSIIRGSKTAN